MITVTQATPKDIPDILAMMHKLCGFYGDTCHLALPDAQDQLITQQHLTALIARKDGAPVGYAVMETKWRPMHDGDSIDIAHLFVEEHIRGHGVGRRIINMARNHAQKRGCHKLTIGTSITNHGAAAAYRAMGHREITATKGPQFHIATDVEG